MDFVDIAGIVQGASKGEGLGNQFLANIRETDAIAHVVRCFEDPDVTHVCDRVDPASDIATIETELLLADLQTLEKAKHRISKAAKSANKQALIHQTLLDGLWTHLNTGHAARTFSAAGGKPLNPSEESFLKSLCLLTAKPTLYIANVSEDGFSHNPHLDAVLKHAANTQSLVMPICASVEAALTDLSDADKSAFLAELGQTEPGLDRLIRAGYGLLDLQTYFTAGVQEVRAWTIPIGATARDAAGVIHTDFYKGFIRAEVIAFADYLAYLGEAGAKEAGKWRLEGKDYVVQDADVLHFRFNV